MATTTSLGMLQFVTARGRYHGLALFTEDPQRGTRLGILLLAGAWLIYVSFAPEIFTPGLAGTELLAVFLLCAGLAFLITVVGSHLRIQRTQTWDIRKGQSINVNGIAASCYPSGVSPAPSRPTVILFQDPTGYFALPEALAQELGQRGLAIITLKPPWPSQGKTGPSSTKASANDLSLARTLNRLIQQHNLKPTRVGLVGIGLAGDLVINSARAGLGVSTVVAISPISAIAAMYSIRKPGLGWLYELSYLQAWRWRRVRTALHQTATAIHGTEKETEVPWDGPSIAVLVGQDSRLVAMRSNGRQLEVLNAPTRQTFRLLNDAHTRHLLLDWLEDKLTHSTSLDGRETEGRKTTGR